MSRLRLKHVVDVRVSNVDKKMSEGEIPVRLCNYTDVYYNERITAAFDFMQATAKPDQCVAFQIRRGDVLITKDSETADDIGVSSFVAETVPNLLCGYHLALVRPREHRIDGQYLRWALASSEARGQMTADATGVTRFGMRSSAIAGLAIPVPDLAVQRAVADYLDRETARIDSLIEKKTLLWRAIINRAARQRDEFLSPSSYFDAVRLRVSGLPRGWTTAPLMHLTDPARPIVYGIVQAGTEYAGGVPYIKTGDLLNFDPDRLSLTAPEIDAQYARARVRPNDIVIAMRASIGLPIMIPDDLPVANLTQGTARVAARNGIDPFWLFQVLQCHVVQQQCLARAVSATFKTLNIWDLRRIKIPIPPADVSSQLTAVNIRQLKKRKPRLLGLSDRLRSLRSGGKH